jgi:hypothetical protein
VLWQCLVDDQSGSVRSEPRQIWAGTGGAYTEGPHLFAVDGLWYLVAAEGGTERGHSVVVARGPTPAGPFESDPRNPLLSHRSTDHPVQNVGHADLVRVDDDSWAMVYLGVRPRGGTPGYHVNGRETFLTSVRMRDGWFRLDPTGLRPAGLSTPTNGFRGFSEDVDADALHPRWVAPGLFPRRFAALSSGRLTLTAVEGRRCLLVTRIPDLEWRATAVLDSRQGEGRLLVRMDERHWFGIGLEGPRIVVEARAGELGLRHVLMTRPVAPVTLSLSCSGSAGPAAKTGAPDRLTASVEVEGQRRSGPSIAGRYLSTEVAGGFTGRMVGVEVTSGAVDVLDFTYAPA